MLSPLEDAYLQQANPSWLRVLGRNMANLQELRLALEYQPSLVTTMGRSKTLTTLSLVKALQKELRPLVTLKEAD